MPTDRELAEFVYDERMSFRLPTRHKRMIEREALRTYNSAGDLLREIVREWVKEREEVKRGERIE